MKLFHRVYGEEGHPLIILHGLFGSSDNWHSLARRFAEHFRVFTVDLRNHGNSPHTDVMTYPVMAEDVREFMEQQRLSEAHVLGHSMGGKVAMLLALRYPERVSKLVVEDIAPRAYPPVHREVLEGLQRVPLASLHDRRAAEAYLARTISEPMVRQFLLKYLVRDPRTGQFKWKFNLEAIVKNYDKIAGWPDVEGTYEGPTLFVRGERSPYIKETDWPLIQRYFPYARLVTIPGAGHWVHVDAPEPFLEVVTNFLLA